MREASSVRVVLIACALVLNVGTAACSAGSIAAGGPSSSESEAGAPVLSLATRVNTSGDRSAGELRIAAVKPRRAKELRVRGSRRSRRSPSSAEHERERGRQMIDRAPLDARPSARDGALPSAWIAASHVADGGASVAEDRASAAVERGAPEVTERAASSSAFLERVERDEVAREHGGDGISYRAWALPGARERLVIARVNEAAGQRSCTRIVLVHPGNLEQWASLPAGWAIEHAWMSADADECAQRHGAPHPDDLATMDGDGHVTWSALHGVYPCELAIEMVLEFPGSERALGRSISFVAPKLDVDGCRTPGPRTASVAVSG